MDVAGNLEVSPMARKTLVLGGARSGKSEIAEKIAGSFGPDVIYVATSPLAPGSDSAWDKRIAEHRARRPPSWRTVEAPAGADLGGVLEELDCPLLVDSLGAWLAGMDGFRADLDRLCSALGARKSAVVLVSDEVGMGVHPSTIAGNAFRDALGELNRRVGMTCEQVLLVVAGRVLPLAPYPLGGTW